MSATIREATQFRAGTSGFSYDAWSGPFYPEDLPAKGRLAFYGKTLPAVEINNTFYRMPRREMLSGWAEQVPEDFRFVLKAPRRITHKEKLKDSGESVRYFAGAAEALGPRLGALFFQLPPWLRGDAELLARFLDEVPEGPRITFEFRHASWGEAPIRELMSERGVAWVHVDEGGGDPAELVATTRFTMLRLRAPGYEEGQLSAWIARVRELEVDEAYVFFKHEDEGVAPALAARAQALWENA